MTLWALGIYFLLLIFVIGVILLVSWLLGPRHREPATGAPYEGGILSEGSARVRLSARFYLIAMFFVVFDLEAVFIYSWAVAANELGWPGYWEIVIFVGVLVVALAYLWKQGALDWNPRSPRGRRASARGI
ncbi:MAG TPA: NADH-quinone oxidoreductase subunit A [Terriglobales bacterium]|nr:NADH-quinone oxidoreductase subunit A [Terriglobales bacterium]